MSYHLIKLIIILVIAGLIGGVINYFRSFDYKKFKRLDFLKSLILGVGASLLIPLLLKLLQLDLFETSKNQPTDFLYIFSLGLIVGIFSSDFIDRVGKVFMKRLDTLENELKDIENAGTEIDKYELTKNFDFQLDENHIEVLEALDNSKYVFRAINGIQREIGKDKEKVRELLTELRSYDLVDLVERPTGKKWKITSDGKAYIPFFYTKIDERSGSSAASN